MRVVSLIASSTEIVCALGLGDQLVARDPDVIVVMPCGWGIERARSEMGPLEGDSRWRGLRAVREGKVFVVDGNQYFNRPGPRLVESLGILAEIFHDPRSDQGEGWARLRC